MTEQQLYQEAIALNDEMTVLRRDLHSHPELGTREFRTSKIVTDFLDDCGIENSVMCGTAVVGVLRGGKPGGVVALRTAMDALPMQDMKEHCAYRSQAAGVMHACGHDVHTTALLYAARLLSKHRDEIPGVIKFLFEPNEEAGGYAKMMIENGAMDNPKVSAVFALNQTTACKVGTVSCRRGQIFSANCKFKIDIYGRAAHGAEPQKGIDAILAGCQIALALQQQIGRVNDPEDAVVLNIGTFTGGEARNVVSKEVHMTGIHRTPSLEAREQLNKMIAQIAYSVGAAYGAEVRLTFENGAAPVINDDAMAEIVETTAKHMLGEEHVIHSRTMPITFAEDCGEFISYSKGCYYNIGVVNPAVGIHANAYSSYYDVDESCLSIAAAMNAAVALNYLKSL